MVLSRVRQSTGRAVHYPYDLLPCWDSPAVSRVIDCTRHAVRKQTCLRDLEALNALNPCYTVRNPSCRSQFPAL